MDVVDLIVHDLRRQAFTGLQVKTSLIDSHGGVQFHLPQSTFFAHERLVIAVVPCTRAGSVADTCLLIPSAAIPSLTSVTEHKGRLEYHGNFRLNPLSARYAQFAHPSSDSGKAILSYRVA